LESLINKKLNNGQFEVIHGLEEVKSSSLIDHLNTLHDAHVRKILKSKFAQTPSPRPQMSFKKGNVIILLPRAGPPDLEGEKG